MRIYIYAASSAHCDAQYRDDARLLGESGHYSEHTINRTIHGMIHSTISNATGTAMTSISANSLKTQGVSAIADALADAPEAMVSVRGKDRFVVMDIEHYRYLRECELAAALAESQADLAAGRFVKESVDAHMKRLAKLS